MVLVLTFTAHTLTRKNLQFFLIGCKIDLVKKKSLRDSYLNHYNFPFLVSLKHILLS